MAESTSLKKTNNGSTRHLHKYRNKNLFHRIALRRFFNLVASEIEKLDSKNVLEFGCGEGFFLQELKNRKVKFKNYIGIDIRKNAIEMAKNIHREYSFIEQDLFSWDYQLKSFDLVIASQVLEHLVEPEKYLKRLVAYGTQNLIITVPWEPWFQIMNFLRGRDMWRLGNHPEHINRWRISEIKSLVSRNAIIHKTKSVFPFLIIVAKVNSASL